MKNFYTFRLLALLSLISIVILINSCDTTPTGPKEAEIFKGVLIDEQGGAIPDAIMEIVSTQSVKNVILEEQIIERDTTDDYGNFNFSKMPENLDGVDIRIIHPDLKPYQESMLAVVDGKDKQNMQLAAEYQDSCCGKIIVHVYSSKDSSVINGVELRLNVESTLKRTGQTNENGTYTFNEVCKYEYWLRLAKSGYEVKEISGLNVDGCEESDYVEVNIYMTPENRDSCCDGKLKIIPKDKETGEILKGVTVKLRKNGVELSRKVNEGDYVLFEGLCQGEYELAILKDGYIGQEISVLIDCDEQKELTVEMTKRECCEGDYALDIIREGYKSIEFAQRIECNDTVDLTKTLVQAIPDSCCKGIVKIYPKDSETKEALNGAFVKLFKNGSLLQKAEVRNGVAIFDGLCEDKYSFLISKDGYQSMDFSVEVDCNETYEFEKLLVSNTTQDSCCEGKVKIYVRDESGNALQYVKVILWKDGKAISDPRTNADGYAVIEGLCKGNYQISLQLEGYKGQEFNFELGCDETRTFEKVLVQNEQDTCCNGKIKAIIKDEDGTALDRVIGKLTKSGKVIGEVKSNSDGLMVFEKLCEGSYVLRLAKDGYKVIEMEIDVDCNEVVELTKTMERLDSCCTAILKLLIKNAEGKAINEAMVILYKNGTAIRDGYTNSDGLWAKDGLCAPANYVVVVKRDGYVDKEFEISYDWCKTIMETVTMQKQ